MEGRWNRRGRSNTSGKSNEGSLNWRIYMKNKESIGRTSLCEELPWREGGALVPGKEGMADATGGDARSSEATVTGSS